MIIYVLYGLELENRGYRQVKMLLLMYWIGHGALYIINFFRFDEFQLWLDHFNDLLLMVPVYVVSIPFTYLADRWIRKRKRRLNRREWNGY
jgi:hypothetical protein